MNIQILVTVAGFLLAVGGNLVWLFVIYGNFEKRKLSAQRDFNHLLNNQTNISSGITHGFDEIENKLEVIGQNILEIKIWIMHNKERGE